MGKRLIRFCVAAGLAAFVVADLAGWVITPRPWPLLAALAGFGFVVSSWWALLFSLIPIFVFLPHGNEVPGAGEEAPGWFVGMLGVPIAAAAIGVGIAASKVLLFAARRRRASRVRASGA